LLLPGNGTAAGQNLTHTSQRTRKYHQWTNLTASAIEWVTFIFIIIKSSASAPYNLCLCVEIPFLCFGQNGGSGELSFLFRSAQPSAVGKMFHCGSVLKAHRANTNGKPSSVCRQPHGWLATDSVPFWGVNQAGDPHDGVFMANSKPILIDFTAHQKAVRGNRPPILSHPAALIREY